MMPITFYGHVLKTRIAPNPFEQSQHLTHQLHRGSTYIRYLLRGSPTEMPNIGTPSYKKDELGEAGLVILQE